MCFSLLCSNQHRPSVTAWYVSWQIRGYCTNSLAQRGVPNENQDIQLFFRHYSFLSSNGMGTYQRLRCRLFPWCHACSLYNNLFLLPLFLAFQYSKSISATEVVTFHQFRVSMIPCLQFVRHSSFTTALSCSSTKRERTSDRKIVALSLSRTTHDAISINSKVSSIPGRVSRERGSLVFHQFHDSMKREVPGEN